MKLASLIVLMLVLTTLPAAGQGTCGVERWDVKVVRDTARASVKATPVPATVAEMVALTRPATVNDALPRTAPVENTVYSISADLILYKKESDQDYHLVIQDNDDNTMIIEIPDPACAASSRFLSQIQSARKAFDGKFKVSDKPHSTQIPVTVTGVGFFDITHGGKGQTGHAPNNIELHPVLSIQFTGPVAPEFTESAAEAAAPAAAPAPRAGPSNGGLWAMIVIAMTLMYIAGIRGTVVTLRAAGTWSLAEALKESDGKPSSSRLIAFLGLLVLMVIYIGVGYVAIWRLLNNQPLPDVNGFLLTGLSLFAPYAFNQIKGTVQGAGGGGGPARAAAKSTPKVMAVTPNSVSANTSTQIAVSGAGFDAKATVTVTTNAGPITPTGLIVAANQIQFAATMPASSGPYVAVVHILNPDGGEATGTFQVR